MKLIATRNTILSSGRDYYLEVDRSSDTLVIAVGDSWTWGDRLGKTTLTYDDREHRTKHVYGNIVADALEANFINLGFPGRDNMYIMNSLLDIFPTLTRTYKKCYIIFSLTESGRELTDGFLDQQAHYNQIRGKDWPTVDEILTSTANSANIEYARDEMIRNNMNFVHHYNLILELLAATSIDDFFIRYERWTLATIQQKFNQFPDSVNWILSRNFTSIRKENLNLFPNLLATNWVDVISDRGLLDPYPLTVDVLSKAGLDPIIKISSVLKLDKFKEDWLDIFDRSSAALDWFDRSPYNSHTSTRHPLEQAHGWWAEFLLEKLK
jgi:hypothetical protein